jgi:hypothetical protein
LKVQVKRKVTDVGSHRGGVIRLDSKLPMKYRKPVVLHERMEDYLMRKRGFNYPKAHGIATQFEKQACFRNKPKEWRRYNGVVGALVRENKR